MPRHGVPCRATVLLLNDLTEAFEGHLATAYLDKRTHHGTNHIAKEAIGLDGEHPFVLTEWCPFGVHDATIVGLHIGVELAETGEVDVFKKYLGSLVHLRKVECVVQSPSVMTVERVLAGGNVIFIGTIGLNNAYSNLYLRR